MLAINLGILKKRRVELYEEVLQMQQQLLSAQYEIHLSVNSALEENMTNGTGMTNWDPGRTFCCTQTISKGS